MLSENQDTIFSIYVVRKREKIEIRDARKKEAKIITILTVVISEWLV